VELAFVILQTGSNVLSGLQPQGRQWLLDLYTPSPPASSFSTPNASIPLVRPPPSRPIAAHVMLQRVPDSTTAHSLSPATDIPLFSVVLLPSPIYQRSR
jgi:hypothetical protein